MSIDYKENDALELCPWHGNACSMRVASIQGRYWVAAMCGAQGPVMRSELWAVKAWNRIANAVVEQGV